MKTYYPEIFAWFLFISVFGSSGCECVTAFHSFSENITFSPEKKQYVIGDTIWLTSKFACTDLLNLETGQKEDFCDAKNLGTNMAVVLLKFDSAGVIIGGTGKFKYIGLEGEIFSDPSIQPNRFKQITFQEQNDQYSIRIGIIPLEAGKFGLFPGNSANVIQNGHHKCQDRAGFGFKLTNTDKHTELYEAFLDSVPVVDYERERGYFFEVIQ